MVSEVSEGWLRDAIICYNIRYDGVDMKKFMVSIALAVIISGVSRADELTAWNNGFYAGAEAGYKLCRIEDRQSLKAYEELVASVFNTKALMFAGRFPLPTAVQKTEVVRKPDGTAEIVSKWEVLPPAYFPLSAIESLKQEFKSGTSVIPAGFGVVVKTDNLPIEKIAYAYYSGTKLGMFPTYLPNDNLLVLGVFKRKADALDSQQKLLSYGVKATVEEIKKPINIKTSTPSITSSLLQLADKMKKKEEELIGIKAKRDSIDYLISVLDRAVATAKALENNPAYREFDFTALERDIGAVKHNVLAYLYDREPYKRVVLYDPYEKERKGYESQIKKLKEENLKLRKETERLKLLVGKKEELKTDSNVIKKYLKGEL